VNRVGVTLLVTLAIAAALRLSMQAAAMPPYAGLDEIYHVARLAFVAHEGRSPSISEAAIPPYIASSIRGDANALPAFGELRERWPDVVAQRPVLANDRVLTENDLTPYVATNYEAQQTSLYYAIAAPLVRLLPQRTPITELRVWRMFSVIFGVIAIVAIAAIAIRMVGPSGVLVGALLLSMPTYMTLIVRASNDALPCALIACACLVTFSEPRRASGWLLEALLWAFALAAKLYAWPASVALPFLWHQQRAPRARRLTVLVAGFISVVATLVSLALRTNNPLGLFAFDRVAPRVHGSLSQIDFGAMARITIASGAWASGQHWNALRPLAMVLYLGPLLALIAFVFARRWRTSKSMLAICFIVAFAFAIAQIVSAGAYIRQALATGSSLPAGGKEGWYWFALAPLFVPLFAIPLRYAPRLIAAFTLLWMIAWDVLITEGALFQDYAGMTRATSGDALFRWGPRALPFTYSLNDVGVGPFASVLTSMRFAEVLLLVAIVAVALRHRE